MLDFAWEWVAGYFERLVQFMKLDGDFCVCPLESYNGPIRMLTDCEACTEGQVGGHEQTTVLALMHAWMASCVSVDRAGQSGGRSGTGVTEPHGFA